MQNYFECKIRYEKTMGNGIEKKITEPYIIDAISFTEAEARLIEEVTPFISGEYTVTDIKRTKIDEIVDSDRDADDKYFKCKLLFVTLDEKEARIHKRGNVAAIKEMVAFHYRDEIAAAMGSAEKIQKNLGR